jgi:S-DNA-T family DNA segregation ATPase FtsK/SpoIIIE
VDLAELPHLLVGGTPGSGKSVFLRQVLAGLLTAYAPDRVRVLLIDLKGGMEFFLFRELPHLWAPVVSDLPELSPALANLIGELERRQAMFARAGVVSLRHWNDSHPAERLPYIVAFVDEFGEVSRPVAESSNDKARGPAKHQAHGAFSRIARLGRALGIHLIVCTQRPDADVMPGQIKDQLPATVAFRTRSETNSHILLGDKDPAAALLPRIKGRAIWQWEDEDEVQAPFIEPAAAVALLREKCVQSVGHARVTQCPTRNQETEGEVAA